jgi:hypothetical protein
VFSPDTARKVIKAVMVGTKADNIDLTPEATIATIKVEIVEAFKVVTRMLRNSTPLSTRLRCAVTGRLRALASRVINAFSPTVRTS